MSFCVVKIRYVKLFISFLCMPIFTYSKFIMTLLVVPKNTYNGNEFFRKVKFLPTQILASFFVMPIHINANSISFEENSL